VKLDIDFSKQAAANDLPDETKDEMFSDLNDVAGANVHDRASDALGGLNDNVVVLAHLEGVEIFCLLAGQVENSLVNGIRDAVIDQLGEYQAILTVIKHFECIGGEGEATAEIRIAGENGVDMAREFGALVLVDGMGDVSVGSLDLDSTAHASFGSVPTSTLRDNTTTGRLGRSGG